MLDDQAPQFEGSREEVRRFLNGLDPTDYYTYLLLDPARTPFYVGKGKRLRALEHELEALRASGLPTSNAFKCARIRKIVAGGGAVGYRIDRIYGTGDQLACLQREEALIARHRRRCDGGVLTNLAAGLGSMAERDPSSAQRHAATLSGASEERPERAVLNLFLRTLGGVDSVPIKPLAEYRARLVSAYPSSKMLRQISRRNVLTLAAPAVALRIRLLPGVAIPRAFSVLSDPDTWPLSVPAPPEVRAVVENGAASDVLRLGLCTLVPAGRPEDEAFALDARQIATLLGALGQRQAAEWNLI